MFSRGSKAADADLMRWRSILFVRIVGLGLFVRFSRSLFGKFVVAWEIQCLPGKPREITFCVVKEEKLIEIFF
jgi:hypothetical protein